MTPEYYSDRRAGATKHGHARPGHRSRAYIAWVGMKQRCKNKNDPYYHCYGGKGIKVCKEWEQFDGFFHDMGDPPDGKTLDRIDILKGYYKSNCRWATSKEQAWNRVSTRYLCVGGVTKKLLEWADLTGTRPGTMHGRLLRGWDHQETVLGKGRMAA